MNQLYIYIYPLFLRFVSHIGYYRVLSGINKELREARMKMNEKPFLSLPNRVGVC